MVSHSVVLNQLVSDVIFLKVNLSMILISENGRKLCLDTIWVWFTCYVCIISRMLGKGQLFNYGNS